MEPFGVGDWVVGCGVFWATGLTVRNKMRATAVPPTTRILRLAAIISTIGLGCEPVST